MSSNWWSRRSNPKPSSGQQPTTPTSATSTPNSTYSKGRSVAHPDPSSHLHTLHPSHFRKLAQDIQIQESVASTSMLQTPVHTIRPKTTQPRSNTSLSLGGLFGIGKTKRPSTADSLTRSTHGHANDFGVLSTDRENTSPSTLHTMSSRNRTNTISSGASSFNPPPLTPASAVDTDESLATTSSFGLRGRSNSANSIPLRSADSRPTEVTILAYGNRSEGNKPLKQGLHPPSLLAVEEYDPFAAQSSSFYIVATPPAIPSDQQHFKVPTLPPPSSSLSDPQRKPSSTYVEGFLTRPSNYSIPSSNASGPLKLPRRPSAPTHPSPTIVTGVPPVSGSRSAGGFTSGQGSGEITPNSATSSKKPFQLPFRARSGSTKGSDDRQPRGDIISRPSGNSFASSSASSLRGQPDAKPPANTLAQRLSGVSSLASSVTNSPSSSGTHLPLPYDPWNPHLSILTSRSDPTSTYRSHVSVSSNSSASSHGKIPQFAPPARDLPPPPNSTPSSASLPQPPSQHPSPSQPPTSALPSPRITLPPELEPPLDSDPRTQQLRAQLAVSIQELADDLGIGKPSSSTINLDLQVDEVFEQAPRRMTPENLLPNGDARLLVKPGIIQIEDGSFELLIPPKPAFLHASGQRSSPVPASPAPSEHYAPSFIGEPLSSPPDAFFCSPYPSGVMTLPTFPLLGRDSIDSRRESSDIVDPAWAGKRLYQGKVAGAAVTGGISSSLLSVTSRLTPSSVITSAPPPPPPQHQPYSPPRRSKIAPPPLPSPHAALFEQDNSQDGHTILIEHFPAPPASEPSPTFLSRSTSTRAKGPLPSPPPIMIPRSRSATLQASSNVSPMGSSPSPSPMSASRSRALTNIPGGSMSTLSFSSSVSSKAARGGQGDMFLDDEDSDIDGYGMGNGKSKKRRGSESSQKRRGSEGREGSSGVMGTSASFGAVGGLGTTSNGGSPKRKIPPVPASPPTPRQTTSHATATATGGLRVRTTSHSGFLASSPISSLINALSSGSFPLTDHHHHAPLPSGSGELRPGVPMPRRQRSFNQVQIPQVPPLPPLRHCSSFNPPPTSHRDATTTTSSNTPPPPHHSNSAPTSYVSSEIVPPLIPRRGSKSNGRSILNRQTSRTSMTKGPLPPPPPSTNVNGTSSPNNSAHGHGPKGEVVSVEYDWTRERERYPDDDLRSLVTLNQFGGRGSNDDSSSWWDEGQKRESPTHTARSISTHRNIKPTSPTSNSKSISAATNHKPTSPTQSDYRPKHIMAPSQLLRVTDGGEEELMSPQQMFDEDDDLLRSDLDDLLAMPKRAGSGDRTWLAEMGVHGQSSMTAINESESDSSTNQAFPKRTVPHRPSLTGRSDSVASRPSLAGRSDSIASRTSVPAIDPQRRRTSASTASSTSNGLVRSAGAPLSPPPVRSRIPRSSISASLRSLPLATPLPQTPSPLSPPPPRARALSSSQANTHHSQDPGTRHVSSSTPRRDSGATLRSEEADELPQLMREPSMASLVGSTRTLKRNDSLMSASGTIRKPTNKRQSIRPSFLDIDFEDEVDDVLRPAVTGGNGRIRASVVSIIANRRGESLLEDGSFLDMGRDNSMEMMRDDV